jgi:hypothetical protein
LLVSYIALWVLVLVQAVALFGLFHHFGEMYLSSRQGRAAQGPDVDALLTHLRARDLDERLIDLPLVGRKTLLVFADTGCGLCGRLRPDISSFATDTPEVAVAVVCGGKLEAIREWSRPLAEGVMVLPDPSRRLAAQARIGITPFLVGVDESGRVRGKGIVNDREGLDAMSDGLTTDSEFVTHEGGEVGNGRAVTSQRHATQ